MDYEDRVEESTYTVVGTSTKIPNLEFYTNYSIGVRACTQLPEIIEPLCGKDWAEATISTGIGSELIGFF